MIPQEIRRAHVMAAVREIDGRGVPPARKPTKFTLVIDGQAYPPKYVLSLAARHATGKELRPDDFTGGNETNLFLRNLGFNIQPVGDASVAAVVEAPTISRKSAGRTDASHNERCPACKEAVFNLLRSLYGKVSRNYRWEAGSRLEYYASGPCSTHLKNIYASLSSLRGFDAFVRCELLPPCDFFVHEPGFAVEFDESQHFTACRKAALLAYPKDMKLGFDREKWIALCDQIMAEDHDPPYRDEQRAWYDTLRDFWPTMAKLLPTVRLHAGAFRWCSLDLNRPADVIRFRELLGLPPPRLGNQEIEFHSDSAPALARVLIAGPWVGDVGEARSLLERIASHWPQGQKVWCLVTPGAFVRFDRDALPTVGDNYQPPPEAVDKLFSVARQCCERLLDDRLRSALLRCARYLTVGVDSQKEKISRSQQHIKEIHSELVCLVDLKTGKIHVTGKAYPTTGQQGTLIRIPDLQSHFVSLDCGPTMVLGCHDLSIYSNRGESTTKQRWRKEIRAGFKQLAKKYKPAVVLHHPHTTIKKTTWIQSWNKLKEDLPSVKNFTGAGRYSEDDEGWAKRHPLDDVLERTKLGPTLDIVVHTRAKAVSGL